MKTWEDKSQIKSGLWSMVNKVRCSVADAEKRKGTCCVSMSERDRHVRRDVNSVIKMPGGEGKKLKCVVEENVRIIHNV